MEEESTAGLDRLAEVIRAALAGFLSDDRLDFATNATTVAVADVLGSEHHAVVSEHGWLSEHPLSCRLSGQMARCPYHLAVGRLFDAFPPKEEWGRYKLVAIDAGGVAVVQRVD